MLNMKKNEWSGRMSGQSFALGMAAAAISLLLAGCGSGIAGSVGKTTSPLSPIGAIQGTVHGGQQPIAKATMYLFAAGTTGYSATNANLLTTSVTTDAGGGFNITGDYSCTANQQIYIVALGGDPGLGAINPNSAIMAALGPCSGLSKNTVIEMNEVTTIGSVFALAPFMSSYSALGSKSSNTAGLAQAFESVKKLTNTATGSAVSASLPGTATGPVATVNTLGDILASCVNSGGGVAGDGSECGALFQLATPTGGQSPTDTIQAALNIAQNPTLNVAALYATSSATPPFEPELTTAPNDWTLSVVYAPQAMNKPVSTTIDADGKVWIADSGNSVVHVLLPSGALDQVLLLNGLNKPSAISIDATGNAWITNKGANSLSVFGNTGGIVDGSPITGNGLANPSALAMDAFGNIWVTNSGANSVSEFTQTGAAEQQLTTGVTTPSAIAIDPK